MKSKVNLTAVALKIALYHMVKANLIIVLIKNPLFHIRTSPKYQVIKELGIMECINLIQFTKTKQSLICTNLHQVLVQAMADMAHTIAKSILKDINQV